MGLLDTRKQCSSFRAELSGISQMGKFQIGRIPKANILKLVRDWLREGKAKWLIVLDVE